MTDLTKAVFAGGAITALLFEQQGRTGEEDPGRDAQALAVAAFVAAFIKDAQTTLDIALYDFRLVGALAEQLVGALRARAEAGVAIRIAHDPTTAPASHHPGGDGTIVTLGAIGKPDDGSAFLSRLAPFADIKPIRGYGALMHNKYLIRDALAEDAAVLMGSANFTNDAWGLQENCLLSIQSQPLSTYYATDFLQLWSRGKITNSTGYHDTGTVSVGGVPVTVAFTPGESATVVNAIVGAIDAATRRVTVAAMVMSSGPILSAVSEAIDRGLTITGLYDGPQMDTVLRQWAEAGVGADKANTWAKVAGHLARKNSTPYSPDAPHDFMHAKLVVADDVLVAGSFNFSNHARGNAENTILVRDKAAADTFDDFIQRLVTKYASEVP